MELQNKEPDNVEVKKVTNKRKWTEREEIILIQNVVEREEDLFGDIKGSGGKRKTVLRKEGWGDISEILNSQFCHIRREPEEIKKKYFNLKQRAKDKIDLIKRSTLKTGGGPPTIPPLTPSEEVLLQSLEGRPVTGGVSGGIDTDDIAPIELSDTKEEKDETTSNDPDTVPDAGAQKPTKKKQKTSQTSTEALVKKNMELDNKRIEMEIAKIQKETEKLQEEVQLIQTKRLYLQLKMEKEFQVTPVFPDSS